MLKSSQFNFIGDIKVQTMQRQSGIFIGESNNAIGWSAHGKDNSVIGNISGQSNLLFHNISILSDPDFIDTPIDDRDINISLEHACNEDHSSSLSLNNLQVNAMQDSNVFVGEGHLTGMDANEKANYSQGSIFGNKNRLLNNLNINNDQDQIDAIIEDQDIKIAHIEKK